MLLLAPAIVPALQPSSATPEPRRRRGIWSSRRLKLDLADSTLPLVQKRGASGLLLPKNASSELSIIVPTYPLHFRKAVDLVQSVRLNVRSSQRVLTLLVVSASNEKPALLRLLRAHDALYWWVRVASLFDVSTCAAQASGDAELLAANATQFRRAQGYDKFVLQASKKTLGALCVGARHALLLDSESLIVRRVDLEAEVRSLHASVRPILFDSPSAGSSAWQNGGAETRSESTKLVERMFARACTDGTVTCAPWDASPTTGRMYGFSLGYFWLFPTAMMDGFVRLLRRLHGSYWRAMRHISAFPGKWFGELALFVYMLHIDADRDRYRAVDVQELLRTHVPELAGNLSEHLWGDLLPRHVDGMCALYHSTSGAMPAWRVKPERAAGSDSDASLFGPSTPATHIELLKRCKPIYLITSAQSRLFVSHALRRRPELPTCPVEMRSVRGTFELTLPELGSNATCSHPALTATSLMDIREGCDVEETAVTSRCRWCSDMPTAQECARSAFVDPWRRPASHLLFVRRCMWMGGACFTQPESERCDAQSGGRRTYSCQLDNLLGAEAG